MYEGEFILCTMSVFVLSTPAQEPRTPESAKISILYAVILVGMAVTQLFTFEEFLVHIHSLGLPVSDGVAFALAPLIIVSEVFAVPFLLRMQLSPAFRYLSMFLGWLAPSLWLFVSVWLASTNVHVDTVGFLGTLGNLTPGWWAVFISLALGVLAAWSSWGLWPGKRSNT